MGATMSFGIRLKCQKLLALETGWGLFRYTLLGNYLYLLMKHITVQELLSLKKSAEVFQLIDVREPYEYDCNIGGQLIPMHEIPQNIHKVQRQMKVVIHCNSGKRSDQIVKWLEKYHQFSNLYSLQGGLSQWAKEVNPAILENC